MKKFNFRLDKIMNYKEQVLGNEKMTMANLLNEKEKVIMRLTALLRDKERCDSELEEKQYGGEITTIAFQVYHRYDQFLKTEIKEVRKALAMIEARIEKQMEVLKKVRLETKSLETVKDTKLADYRKEEIKDAEHLMDEYISAVRVMHSNSADRVSMTVS